MANRLNEIVTIMHRKQKQAENNKEEQRSGGKKMSSRSQLLEGNEREDGEEKLRWKVHLLEKEKLELTSSHNQEVKSCRTMHVVASPKITACCLINANCL